MVHTQKPGGKKKPRREREAQYKPPKRRDSDKQYDDIHPGKLFAYGYWINGAAFGAQLRDC